MPSGSLDREGEPVLLFRCEGGGIAGYITIDAPELGEDGSIPDGAVPVQFDSPPPCETD